MDKNLKQVKNSQKKTSLPQLIKLAVLSSTAKTWENGSKVNVKAQKVVKVINAKYTH